jgi:hypothetical protein
LGRNITVGSGVSKATVVGISRTAESNMLLLGRVDQQIEPYNLTIRSAGTTTLTADNQVLDNRYASYIRLDSDDATATNRDFKIRQGYKVGATLILEFVSATNACKIADDAACRNFNNSGDAGNVRLSADWTPDQYDTLVLIYNGTDWVELTRSSN